MVSIGFGAIPPVNNILLTRVSCYSFWKTVQNYEVPGTNKSLFTDKMKKDILQYRALILNPFSHYDLTRPQFRSELVASINLLKQIKARLKEKIGIS